MSGKPVMVFPPPLRFEVRQPPACIQRAAVFAALLYSPLFFRLFFFFALPAPRAARRCSFRDSAPCLPADARARMMPAGGHSADKEYERATLVGDAANIQAASVMPPRGALFSLSSFFLSVLPSGMMDGSAIRC